MSGKESGKSWGGIRSPWWPPAGSGSFDPESVRMAFSLGASKYIALLNDHKVPSRDGRPIAAILESEVAGLEGEITHRELLDRG